MKKITAILNAAGADIKSRAERLMKDLRAWFPKVKTDGFIFGDDYDWRAEADCPVRMAVDNFLASSRGAKLLSKKKGQ